MSKSKKGKFFNILILVIIALMVIPQTRKPIQVFLNKGIAKIIKPSIINASEREQLSSYNWTLRDMEGNTFNLSTAEGKIIIINFWATWCPPCIAEMPSLDKLFQKYESNDDVVFLFVSNEEKAVLNEFKANHNYKFLIYQPVTDYPSSFDVTSVPRTFIISKQGDIVIDKSGAADWSSEKVITTINSLLK